MNIQTEIRVHALLDLYRTETTSHYLCFNIAKMLKSELEKHDDWSGYMDEWTNPAVLVCRGVDSSDVERYEKSGYLYFDFIDSVMNRVSFEQGIIAQLETAILKFFDDPGFPIKSHSDINHLASKKLIRFREFREAILSKIVQNDPDAVFVIEC